MVMRTMRNNIGILKWMFLVLLLAFGVGMVLPGSMGNRSLATAAAIVGDEGVSQQRYSSVLTQRLEQDRRAQGGELTEAESLKVRRQALNDLIDEELSVQFAKDLGQTMTDAEFRDAVVNDPSLKDQQGNFDPARYQQVLQMQAEQGVPWKEAEANFKRGMLLNKVQGFFASQALLSPAETDAAIARLNRQVKAQAAVWDLAAVQKTLSVNEDDLRSYYSRNKQRWAKTPQYKLRQILIRTEFGSSSATAKAKAEGILAKLKAGASFNALAATENADEASRKAGGELGWMGREDLRHPELAVELPRLKAGQTSGVIGTSEGFYILKMEDRKEGFEPTFENTRAKALADWGKEKAAKEADKLARQALALVKSGKSLAEAAAATQGHVVSTGWFGRDDENALPALGKTAAFAQSLLDLDKGAVTEQPAGTDKAVAIAVLTDEKPGAAPSKPALVEQRRRAALGQARNKKTKELYDAWLAGLREKTLIKDQTGVLASK